jgi:putative flippase GtrA
VTKPLQAAWDIKAARFVCVGVINTTIDISLLNVFVIVFHVPTLLSNLVSASTSISISYFLNHRIVFRSADKRSWTKFAHFFVLTGLGILAIQTLTIYSISHALAHHLVGENQLKTDIDLKSFSTKALTLNIAKLTAVVVSMVWNFCVYHFIVFRNKQAKVPRII